MRKLLCILAVLSLLLTLASCGVQLEDSYRSTKPSRTETRKPSATEEDTIPTEETTETVPRQTTPSEDTPHQPTIPPETEPEPTPVETQPAVIEPPYVEPEPQPTYGHTPLAKTEYYQYSQMTASEKQLYNKLVKAVENLQNTLPVTGMTIKADDALNLFYRVLADNPQYFWVARQSTVIYDSRTEVVEKFVLQYTDGEKCDTVDKKNRPTVVADRAKIAAKRKALEEKISRILNTVPANIPEVEREKLFHDYILANVSYDTVAASNPSPVNGQLPHAFDIYGAAIEGKAVCEGYSKLFQYLCCRTGINATQIPGEAGGGGHMWNAVKLDGDWYEIDVTWDDGSETVPFYGYFNLPHSQMAQTHTADTTRMPYPQCNGDKYRYADYFALKAVSRTQVSDNYEAVVDRLIDEGSGYLILYKNNVRLTGSDYNTLIYSENAAINQYANRQGYKLQFAKGYSTYDEFVYFRYTVIQNEKNTPDAIASGV